MIDTHCHVDLFEDPAAIAKESERRKLPTVAVTYLPSHFELALRHLADMAYVRPALGLHPLAAAQHAAELPTFRDLIRHAFLVGEVGLDFSPAGSSTRARQEQSFEEVVDCLKGPPRYVSIHSRSAEDAVLAQLRRAGITGAVFHWFSGTAGQLTRVLDGGHFVSINTEMIKTARWRAMIQRVPKGAVLTESDGPFAKHDGRPARPEDVRTTVRWLADNWSCSAQAAEEQIMLNAARSLHGVQGAPRLPPSMT